MALSDACGDFLSALCDGTGSPKELVREPTKEIDGYDGEPWGYDESELSAVRETCEAFWQRVPVPAACASYGWPCGASLAERIRGWPCEGAAPFVCLKDWLKDG